jgi:hypothetical protein
VDAGVETDAALLRAALVAVLDAVGFERFAAVERDVKRMGRVSLKDGLYGLFV